jgi:ABC-type Fe3+ transport system permease subunit
MVLMLLATMLICIHTLQTIYAIFYNDKKDPDFLVGAEYGCCGLGAIGMSFFAMDAPVKAKSKGARRRIFSRILTLGIQIPIIVVACASLNIIQNPNAWQSQKTSVFVLLTVVLLHISNALENIYDGMMAVFEL